VDPVATVPYQSAYFLKSKLAGIGGFQSAARVKSAVINRKNKSVEFLLVLLVERAVYEHVPICWPAKLRHEESEPIYDRAGPMEPRECNRYALLHPHAFPLTLAPFVAQLRPTLDRRLANVESAERESERLP